MYDVIGVGFGPSNLALAIALEEEMAPEDLDGRVLFLEQNSTSRWHPGLMLPGAALQVSFLKDLVTLRNPTSPYSFVNYVHRCGRLDEFVNLRSFYPSRAEFAGYISWVAGSFAPMVRYDAKVKSVRGVHRVSGGPVEALRIETTSGHCYECRTLVAASGGAPEVPRAFRSLLGPRVFHSSEYLARVPPPEELEGSTVAVVGSGQSAAEVIHHLLTNTPEVNVVSIIRDFALRPMDDSKFVNEVFFPSAIEFTYNLGKHRRQEFLNSVRQSNYSAVDMELIDELYGLAYEARVNGSCPLRFVTHARVEEAADIDGKIAVRARNRMNGDIETVAADYVVLATGFAPRHVPAYLRRVLRYFKQREGLPDISWDYRLEPCNGDVEVDIFLQGFAERTHGISDTLLSVAAHRAGVIAPLMAERMRKEA